MPSTAKSDPPMTETIDSANAAASTLFLGHNGEWWDFWLIVSLVFVALAAMAAGITTAGSIVSHKREAESADAALERFKLQTELKISEADARAAEAKLALEKFKAPRSLSAEQQARITAEVKAFGAIPFDFAIQTEPEAIDLMEQISTTLESAGWIRKPAHTGGVAFTNPGKPQAGIVSFSGFAIHIDDSRTAEWGDAVATLWKAIEAEGIAASAMRLTDKSESADAVHIKIGKKP